MYMDTCGCMHMYGASSAWGPGRALDGLHVSFPLSNHSGSEVARAKYIVLSVISGRRKYLPSFGTMLPEDRSTASGAKPYFRQTFWKLTMVRDAAAMSP